MKQAIRAADIEACFNALERAQRITLELTNGLRRDANPELVDRMSSLYNFVYRRLVEANMQRDAEAVEDALKILRHQRKTWTLVIEKIATVVDAPEASATPSADQSTGSAFSVEG